MIATLMRGAAPNKRHIDTRRAHPLECFCAASSFAPSPSRPLITHALCGRGDFHMEATT